VSATYQCLNCKTLGRCKTADEEKIRSAYCCERWEPAVDETVHARNKVIEQFGNQGLLTTLKTEIKEE